MTEAPQFGSDEALFRRMLRERNIHTAEQKVQQYLYDNNLTHTLKDLFDFNMLAKLFEGNQDDTIPNDETWKKTIEDYILYFDLPIKQGLHTYTISVGVKGHVYINVMAENPKEAGAKALRLCSQEEFGKLDDIEQKLVYAHDETGKYYEI